MLQELYEELPAIYDQRVLNTSECLQTLYAAESTFMREGSKVFNNNNNNLFRDYIVQH